MARKRMIDPSLWTDEGMAELTWRQQLLYIGLFSNADDEGRLKGSTAAIALMLPTVYSTNDRRALDEDLTRVLASMSKLRRYVVDGRPYLVFTNYADWQRIDRPTPSILPPPGTFEASIVEDSSNARRDLAPSIGEKKRKEEKRKEAAAAAPSTLPRAPAQEEPPPPPTQQQLSYAKTLNGALPQLVALFHRIDAVFTAGWLEQELAAVEAEIGTLTREQLGRGLNFALKQLQRQMATNEVRNPRPYAHRLIVDYLTEERDHHVA